MRSNNSNNYTHPYTPYMNEGSNTLQGKPVHFRKCHLNQITAKYQRD